MRFAIVVVAIGLLATATSSATERYVGAQHFALREGDWYLVDEHDEEWKVAPGRIFINLAQGATPECWRIRRPWPG